MLSCRQPRLFHRALEEAPSSGPTSSGSRLLPSWPGGRRLPTEQGSGFLIKPNLVPRLENTQASKHDSGSRGLGWSQEERREEIKTRPGVQKRQPSPRGP